MANIPHPQFENGNKVFFLLGEDFCCGEVESTKIELYKINSDITYSVKNSVSGQTHCLHEKNVFESIDEMVKVKTTIMQNALDQPF